MEKNVTAGIILIGDELLSGRTQDTNLSTIACWLEPLGVQVGEARIVADDAKVCLLYTSPSPRDRTRSRMPSSA